MPVAVDVQARIEHCDRVVFAGHTARRIAEYDGRDEDAEFYARIVDRYLELRLRLTRGTWTRP